MIHTRSHQVWSIMCSRHVYVENILKSMELNAKLPMLLKMDNKDKVYLANNWCIGGCTRHVHVQQCFLREFEDSKVIDIFWIKGSENHADVFTKNFDGPAFKKCIKMHVGQDACTKTHLLLSKKDVGRNPRVLRTVSRIFNNGEFVGCESFLYL